MEMQLILLVLQKTTKSFLIKIFNSNRMVTQIMKKTMIITTALRIIKIDKVIIVVMDLTFLLSILLNKMKTITLQAMSTAKMTMSLQRSR